MMKTGKNKRFLASVLSAVMILTMLPSAALAADGAEEKQTASATATTETTTSVQPETNVETNGVDASNEEKKSEEEAQPSEAPADSQAEETPKAEEEPSGSEDSIFSWLDAEPEEQILTAEYWVTNSKAECSSKNTLEISSTDSRLTGKSGIAVEDLAPKNGTNGNFDTIFWQARVLSEDSGYQTTESGVNQTAAGEKVTKIRYNNDKFQYRTENGSWTTFQEETSKKSADQLVFYYLIQTDFAKGVSVSVSDWPVADSNMPNWAPSPHQINYEVYELPSANAKLSEGVKLGDTVERYYYSALTISAIQVEMNEHEQYYIQKVIVDPENQYADQPNVQASKTVFSVDLSKAGKQPFLSMNDVTTIKIYVTAYKYLLNYETNGGIIKNSKGNYTAAGSYFPNDDVEAPTKMERTGYTFTGWYTDEDLTQAWADNKMPAHDLTLYAGWELNRYNITFKTEENGTIDGSTDPVLREDVAHGTPVTAPETNANEGYEFQGWEDDNGNLLQEIPNATGDATYTAKWKLKTYPVTWKNGDDIAQTENVEHRKYPTENPEVTKTNPEKGYTYTFKGWKLEGTEDSALVDPTQCPVTAPVTYVAVYEKTAQEFTVTYILDGETYSTAKYTVGKWVTKAEDPAAKEGHTFSGWTVETEGVAFGGTGVFKMPAKNVVIVGSYQANTYTVTYILDGKAYGNVETYAYGTKVTIQGAPALEKGYRFDGWKMDGQKAVDFQMPAKNIVITGTTSIATAPIGTVKMPYSVEHYKWNPEKAAYELVTAERNFAAAGTQVQAKANTYEGYVLNPWAEGFRQSGEVYKVTADAQGNISMLTLKLYYDPDTKGSSKDPDNQGDGTPDRYQYKVTYKVENGKWDGPVTDDQDYIIYLSAKNMETGETIQPKLVATDLVWAGGSPDTGYVTGGWKNIEPKVGLEITGDTVFTYAYQKKSSGGHHSSGGSNNKPTVDIPDDVPTGLDGDNHFAYIIGRDDGKVHPEAQITRAEVATIFFRLLTEDTRTANSTKVNNYSDVNSDRWYNHAISTLSKMGIIKGTPQGTFNPNASITRAEFAAIAARFDDKNTDTSANFSDILSHWAKDEIGIAANKGWVNGYTDGTFRPDQYITRAEAMTLVNRVLNRLPENTSDLLDGMIQWPDNQNTAAWYYLAVQEATNSHDCQLKDKETKYEKWTKLNDVKKWAELEH
jgi:uncharacterized repeat protein (TIGR02543 family)